MDRLRGLILVIMAIDHASLFIARRHSSESWDGSITIYTTAFPFLTRFVTHLCAPGFFFLMGAGMAMFASSRQKLGWSNGRISAYMLTRGAVLILVNHLVENPAWVIGTLRAGGPSAVTADSAYLVFGVLSGLGMAMAMGGLLLRFGSALWLTVGVAALFATNLVVPAAEHAHEHFSVLTRLMLLPGRSGLVYVIYPAMPWFALTAFGVVIGRAIQSDARFVHRSTPWLGVTLVGIAFVVRAHGGFGNILLPRSRGWIEFLNFVKYPPAMVFSLSMLGINLMLLGLMAGPGWWLERILAVYGRAALCFYLAHLYLYATIGALLFANPTSLPEMYAVWFTGLIPLYLLCRWYGGFKESKAVDSLWRLF